MEINLNCDLGEKSIHYDGKNDLELIKIINSVNIACGYHAGSKKIINETIINAKEKNVSIGAHPGFNDLKNFGRKKINISEKDLVILIKDQLAIIDKIANKNLVNLTHVKPHGGLNNMACENLDVALIIGKTIKEFNKELIYVVLPLTEMEVAAKKINIKYACEIFADRNYQDNGRLIERKYPNALIKDPIICAKNTIEMLESSSIKSFNGARIKCAIDSICIHGDGDNSIQIAKLVKKKILNNGFTTLSLNNMSKFN